MPTTTVLYTTLQGFVYQTGTYSQVKAGTGTNQYSPSGSVAVGSSGTTASATLYEGILGFDTSTIPAGHKITSAVLSFLRVGGGYNPATGYGLEFFRFFPDTAFDGTISGNDFVPTAPYYGAASGFWYNTTAYTSNPVAGDATIAPVLINRPGVTYFRIIGDSDIGGDSNIQYGQPGVSAYRSTTFNSFALTIVSDVSNPPTVGSTSITQANAGTVAVGANNSPVSIKFTALDDGTVWANGITYDIRTASGGGGVSLGTGTCTSGVEKTATVTNAQLTAGTNVLWVRVFDGASYGETSVSVFKDSTNPTVGTITPSLVDDSRQFTATFTPTDAESGGTKWEVWSAAGATGTLCGSGTWVISGNPITTSTLTHPSLASGSSTTVYLRVYDGAWNVVESGFTILRPTYFADTDSGSISSASGGTESLNTYYEGSDTGFVFATESVPPIAVSLADADSGSVSGNETSDSPLNESALVTAVESSSVFVTFGDTDSGSISAASETWQNLYSVFPGEVDTGTISATEIATAVVVFVQVFQLPVENGININVRETSIELDAVVYPNDSQIDLALQGGYGPPHAYPRMYRVDREANRLGDISSKLLSGNISVDRTQPVSRSGAFTLKDLDGFDVKTDWLMPVYVMELNGIELEFEQGIFQATLPSKSYMERTTSTSVTANDLSVLLATGKFAYPFTVSAGTNYTTAVRSIASLAGITRLNISPTTKTLPNDFTWYQGTPYGTGINDLLQGINYLPFWFDRKGVLTSRPRVQMVQRTADVTYGTDRGTRMVLEPFDPQFNQGQLLNEVVIQVNDPLRNAFWSTYYIENALSPVCLPYRYGLNGWSSTSYLSATNLTGASLTTAVPSFPSDQLPAAVGSVSLGGWTYVTATDTNKQIGGVWGSASTKSFLLRSCGSVAGKPEFVVSGDGSAEVLLAAPTALSTGWHHIMGVFTPGLPVGANMVVNGGFEITTDAVPQGWTRSGSGTMSTETLAFNASVPTGGGTKSFDVTFGSTTASQTLTYSQDLRSGFTVGRKVQIDYARYFITRQTNASIELVLEAYDSTNTIISTLNTTSISAADGSWQVAASQFALVPTGTAFLRLKLNHKNGTTTSNSQVRWDLISVADTQDPFLGLYVDGVEVATQTTSLPTTIHQNASYMKLGYTGYPGTDAASTGMMAGIAVYYGRITAADVLSLYNGMYPTNVPWCLAYWHMDTLQGLPLPDESNRGFTLFPVAGHALVYRNLAGTIRSGLKDRDRFKAQVDVIDLPRIQNQATADAAALIFAEDNASQYLSATLNTTFDPRRDLNEIYQVYIFDAAGNTVTDRKWVVDGWAADFKTAGTMQHKIRRVEQY